MAFLNSFDISASGLTAQRLRMDLISQNITNADTTRTENGMPYRRKVAVFQQSNRELSFADYLSESSKRMIASRSLGSGVSVARITEDTSPFKRVYNPGHPDSGEDGYIIMPNVDITTEMVNMISAARSYEANIAAINSTKSMAMKALEIGK